MIKDAHFDDSEVLVHRMDGEKEAGASPVNWLGSIVVAVHLNAINRHATEQLCANQLTETLSRTAS